MINRSVNILKLRSFFLFGARGTGKSTWLKRHFIGENQLSFDLLDAETLEELTLEPSRFRNQILAQKNLEWVFVDEIQRCPKLLDYVHSLIESHKIKFALTGSSARRLRQKGVNLLAGRASVYDLYPFSSIELAGEFELNRALTLGGLPESYLAPTREYAWEFLKAYALTYLEKEIQREQWVRKLDPFRRFLQVAAQMNGKIINRARIAEEVGVDDTTVESYFEILCDTLMGFMLPSYHKSVRKQQRVAPKFYFIDTGIKRAIEKTLSLELLPQTAAYGEAFEHWVILDIKKHSSYLRKEWSFFYFTTKEGKEIDLVIERPGKPTLLLEIKSKTKVTENDVKTLNNLADEFKEETERILLSRDETKQKIGKALCIHWQEGLELIFNPLS